MTKIANQEVRNVLQWYVETYNNALQLPVKTVITGHYVDNNEQEQRAIARAFDALPMLDTSPECELAYEQLRIEIELQWNWLQYHGYTMEAWNRDGQPYANSIEMCADVRNNKHLWYFTGGEPHAFLGQANELLRAVHDMFGHSAEGYQFGKRGEVNAWLHHSQMFSPVAQIALTSETHGQNSWVNFGPHSHLPVSERPFADQKVALLPREYCNWRKWLA